MTDLLLYNEIVQINISPKGDVNEIGQIILYEKTPAVTGVFSIRGPCGFPRSYFTRNLPTTGDALAASQHALIAPYSHMTIATSSTMG